LCQVTGDLLWRRAKHPENRNLLGPIRASRDDGWLGRRYARACELRIIGDESIAEAHYRICRAIVVHEEPHDRFDTANTAREAVGEVTEKFDRGTTEAIQRLIIVTDNSYRRTRDLRQREVDRLL